MKVTGKSRHRRNADNDLVCFSSIMCTKDAFYDGSSNLVLDWVLTVCCRGDEELVFNVDEMLAIMDDLYVCICNRVLLWLVWPSEDITICRLTSRRTPLLHSAQLLTS